MHIIKGLGKCIGAIALTVGAGAINMQMALAQESLEIPERFDFLPNWEISGSNTARYEIYEDEGSQAASPYPFLGPQFFDEFNVNFATKPSAYNSWRGRIIGLFNDSEYRAQDDAFIIERANLTQENGEGRVPYRLEMGDFFGFHSFRTLQRSLKGGQVELQPAMGGFGDALHSIQILSGSNLQAYTDGEAFDDYFNGASWLMSWPNTNLSANLVHNFRHDDAAANVDNRHQIVSSLSGIHEALIGGQELTFEGEFAHLFGDIAVGGAQIEDQYDTGYFAQVTGRSDSPLTYRARFEYYGKDFRPNGGVVAADRRTIDTSAGWRFDTGLQLTGRAQQFADSFETGNKLETEVAGVNLTGPVPFDIWPGLNMSLDSFAQRAKNQDETTDTFTRAVNLGLNAPIDANWSAALNLQGQFVRDQTTGGLETVTRQVSLNLTRSIDHLGWSGTLTPGLILRAVNSAAGEQDDYGFNVSTNLFKGGHSFNANYRFLHQDQRTAASTNIPTHNINTAYSYRFGPHELGIDAEFQDRAPDPGAFTTSYRFGVFYTLRFDKPTAEVRASRRAQPVPAPGVDLGPVDYPEDIVLADLPPGMALTEANGRLEAAGVAAGVDQGGVRVYSARFFDQLSQLQRVALAHDGQSVIKSAVIIDLVNVGDVDGIQRVFQEVQQILANRYGNPETFERGQFGVNVAADINSDTVIRLSEWRLPDGVLRLGIPRRIDEQVRIEIQYGAAFPPPTQTRWSLEQVF